MLQACGVTEDEYLSVGRLAELAGVTVRTLHHYDEIGLVRPSARTAAGYRAYTAADVSRLRQVLTYRRLGFGLREVAELVTDPSVDAVAHLRRQRARPACTRCTSRAIRCRWRTSGPSRKSPGHCAGYRRLSSTSARQEGTRP